MPKYTAVLTEHHTVTVTLTDEFDTSDISKWESLKENAKYAMSSKDFQALPQKPPKDPAIWVTLYRYLDRSEYEDKESDWISLNQGGYETSLDILDIKGKIIYSE